MTTDAEVRAYIIAASPPEAARTTHDAIRALLLLVPLEPLTDDLCPSAHEAAIRRTIRALDRLVHLT